MTKARIECKKTTTIAQAKLTHWNDFVGNLDDRVDLDNVYKEIKKIKQQYCPLDFDLRVGDRVFQTNQAKADAFPEVLADASSTHHLPAGMQEYRDSYETAKSAPGPCSGRPGCELSLLSR